jgi:hypothetical protein
MVTFELDRDAYHLIREEGASLVDEVHQVLATAQSVDSPARWRLTCSRAIAEAMWSWFRDHIDAYRFITGRKHLVPVCQRAADAIRAAPGWY